MYHSVRGMDLLNWSYFVEPSSLTIIMNGGMILKHGEIRPTNDTYKYDLTRTFKTSRTAWQEQRGREAQPPFQQPRSSAASIPRRHYRLQGGRWPRGPRPCCTDERRARAAPSRDGTAGRSRRGVRFRLQLSSASRKWKRGQGRGNVRGAGLTVRVTPPRTAAASTPARASRGTSRARAKETGSLTGGPPAAVETETYSTGRR